jgi:hypothetical protein
VAFGVGAVATKKKMKCLACGEYKDTESARPYGEPASAEGEPATPPIVTTSASEPTAREPRERKTFKQAIADGRERGKAKARSRKDLSSEG